MLFLASFMNLIDISIVNVALPRIEADTGASPTQLKWVAEIYVLALAMGLLPFGRFGDVYGRDRLFLWGLVAFTVASAACGSAPTIQSLIAARAVQGAAAAMMVPQVLAIIHVVFPPDEKARVFGLFGTISSLGVVVGPVIGGALISADIAGLGWRPAFLINLPLGVLAALGALKFLPRLPANTGLRPDWLGTALFALAALCLVLPLIEGRALGWPWWTFVLMAATAPLALAFFKVERHRGRRNLPTLVPPSLLSNRVFLQRIGLITLFFSGIPGLFLVLAIFLQSGFGLSPLASGLVTTPFPVGVMLASMTTDRFGNRHLPLRVALGAGCLVLGMVGLLAAIGATDGVVTPLAFALPLMVAGVGMGAAVMALFQMTMSRVAPEDAGAGSGAMQAFQQLGAALGIAIAGQLFFGALGDGSPADYVAAAMRATGYSLGAFACLTALMSWRAIRS